MEWSPFVRIVRSHRRFVLTTHVRPDGDGLGSMLALDEALRGLNKEVRCLISSSMPPRYRFLDSENHIQRHDYAGAPALDADVVVVMDTGTWNQLGTFAPALRSFKGVRVVIDHHQTQDDLCAVQFVNVSAEATGRLTFEAIQALGIRISDVIAKYLFVALAMDTGWFRHSNATPATFELAARLVHSGAQPDALYERLFEDNTVPRLKLMGLVLDRLQVVSDGKVAFTEIHRSDYQATQAVPQDTEDMVNLARGIAGIEVGLLFMEQPAGGVKVSFRSRSRIDVAKVAEQFGGGGHRLAAGAVLPGSLEEVRSKVLTAVSSALNTSH